MEIREVKNSLNKMVKYRKIAGIYKLTGCILRKNEKGFFYQAELLDTKHGNSITICRLEEVEVIE